MFKAARFLRFRRFVRFVIATVALFVPLCCMSCSDGDAGAKRGKPAIEVADSAETLRFDVHWPLVDPAAEKPRKTRPLLEGWLTVRPERLDTSEARMVIRLTLARPEDDKHRRFWNASLAYDEYDWMEYVRVWDNDNQWLYPNLAFLFKLHGTDRIERYGGWDRGNEEDNDFGAVLIRKYGTSGKQEHPDTDRGPLVSAAWHAVGAEDAGTYTIVHRAQSDEFTIHLVEDEPPYGGRIKVWFVYGDFMGHRAPESWPAELELNGGAIAFFHIDWRYQPGKPFRPVIVQQTPEHTGFDWSEWVGRKAESEEPLGRAKLMDRQEPSEEAQSTP